MDDPDLTIRLIRAQEISRYVELGYLDAGITGHDWIIENHSDVHEVGEFIFSKVSRQATRWVLAVPEESPIRSVKDLEGKRIATEVTGLTKRWLKKHGVKAEVEFSWGPPRSRPGSWWTPLSRSPRPGPSGPTNSGLWRPFWRARRGSFPTTRHGRIRGNGTRLKPSPCSSGAIEAEAKVGLKMNIREGNLPNLLQSLPALRNPTVSGLSQSGWVAVETIIDEAVVRELIPQLKAAGAEGIIEYPLNKVVY